MSFMSRLLKKAFLIHDRNTAIRSIDDYERALGEIGYDSDDDDLNSRTVDSEVGAASDSVGVASVGSTPDDDDDDSYYIFVNRYSFCI